MKKHLVLSLLTLSAPLFAANITWVGTTPELTINTNWSPNTVPAPGDTAFFDSTASTYSPLLAANNLTTDTFSFTDNTAYIFTVQNNRFLTLNVGGITNTANGTQTFNFESGRFILNNAATTDDATVNLIGLANLNLLQFFGTSSAGTSHLNILNPVGANLAGITFDDTSTASSAIITATATTGFATVQFSDSGTAGSSHISTSGVNAAVVFFGAGANAGTATINATNNSEIDFILGTAANATLNADSGALIRFQAATNAAAATINATDNTTTVQFINNASASSATIAASNGADVVFSNAATGASAALTLSTAATLTINQNNTLGSLASDATALVNLNGFNLQIGSNNQSQTFAGIAFGVGGSLTKEGSGRQTLSGANTYTGPTTVNAGILSLTGSVAGNFVVNAGGTSQGNGTVGGSYTQNDGSFFLVESTTFLNVVGPVTLSGGEVAVADAVYPVNTPFVILHSDVSRTGVFDGAFAFNPYLNPVLSYDAQNVYLTLASQFQSFALTPNEIAVAGALDFVTDPTLIANLMALGIPEFLNALNQLSGVQYANLIQLSELSHQRFVGQIFDPLRQNTVFPCKPHCGEWYTFASIEGGQSFLRSDYNAQGFKAVEGDVNLGAYRYFNSSCALGVAGRYEYDWVNFYQGGRGSANTVQGAFYGLATAPLGYLFAAVEGGYSHWTVERDISFSAFTQTAKSNPHITHISGYAELGLNRPFYSFLIQPFFGLEYGHYWRASTQESGAAVANLNVAAQNFEDVESRLGVHLYKTVGCVLLNADADWRYRYSPLGDELNLSFVDFGPEFVIVGPAQRRSSFEAFLYAETFILPTVTAYIQGGGIVNNRFASYSATIGLQKVW